MDPAELSAEGLLLRAWQPEDAAAVYRACQDGAIRRWVPDGVPVSAPHAETFVGPACAAAWAGNRGAPMGVFDAQTGTLLGAHGLVHLDLDGGVARVGGWTAPWARGQRVAERATRAVARWALDVLRLRLLECRFEVGNHTARLVAARVGFVFDAPARAAVPADGGFTDGWRGTLRPGEVRGTPTGWWSTDGAGSRRARLFAATQPVLAGDGVTLRALAGADVERIVLTYTDPESVRWTDIPVPYRATDAENIVRTGAPRLWARGEGAVFAVAGPDDGFLGSIDIRISEDDPMTGSVGFLIAPDARGRGVATAALRTICRWGFEALGLVRIVWRAYPGNAASQRVAQKVGFVAEGVQRAGCQQRGERRDAWVAALLAT